MLFVVEQATCAPMSFSSRPVMAMTVNVASHEGAAGGNLEVTGDFNTDELKFEKPVVEDFDWEAGSMQRKFARLEAAYLAGKLSEDESLKYQKMLKSRRAFIFSKTYIQNYAESQRLKRLNVMLKKIGEYLKPIRIQ